MVDSDLILVLKSFTNEEFKQFRKFVNSPYLNERKDIAKFFEVIRKYYPHFNKGFTKEKIFLKIFPDEKYNDAYIRKMMSYLLSLAEKFLSYEQFKDNSFLNNLNVVDQLNARRVFKLFDKRFRALYKNTETLQGNSSPYFFYKDILERTKGDNLIFTGKNQLSSETRLKRANYHLNYFLINSFFLIKAFSRHSISYDFEFKNSDFYKIITSINVDEYLANLKNEQSPDYFIIAIYYYLMKVELNINDNESFANFKQELEKSENKFEYLERVNLHIDWQTLCINNIFIGNQEYLNELFIAYEQMLAKNLYSYALQGNFIPELYRQILNFAIMANKIEWVKDFIKDFENKLALNVKESFHNYGETLLAFNSEEYERALESLSKVNYDIYYLRIDVRNILAKIYYELGYYEQLFFLVDSYKHFISENPTISVKAKKLNHIFIDITNRLAKTKLSGKKDNIVFIEKELKNLPYDLNRQWLTAKIAEFKK